jgi:hypothetical protein
MGFNASQSLEKILEVLADPRVLAFKSESRELILRKFNSRYKVTCLEISTFRNIAIIDADENSKIKQEYIASKKDDIIFSHPIERSPKLYSACDTALLIILKNLYTFIFKPADQTHLITYDPVDKKVIFIDIVA